MPLSQVRSILAGAGMSLWMSYSARAVAGAPLSGMNRANRRRLLRSTCVSMHRFEGAVPTTVSDSVFCQIFVGRFGVSFSPFERLFLGRFGFGQSCGLSVIA